MKFSNWQLSTTVGLTAFAVLMIEMLLARMYVFFLGNINSLIAIPITMLGLSVGSLVLHYRPSIVKAEYLKSEIWLFFSFVIAGFVSFFALFNNFYGINDWYAQNPVRDASKIISLTLVFVPAFAMGSIVLATAFKLGSSKIGRLYAVDLLGSSIACVATVVILHFFGLAYSIIVLHVLLAVLVAQVTFRSTIPGGVFVVGFAVAILLFNSQWGIFVEKVDASNFANASVARVETTQLKSRWDEISRVALIKYEQQNNEPQYQVRHDDGVSTVYIYPYEESTVTSGPRNASFYGLPFQLDHTPESALFLFAGAGRDMIRVNEYARGQIDLTGVEISRLVSWIVTTAPFDIFNLNKFFCSGKCRLCRQ